MNDIQNDANLFLQYVILLTLLHWQGGALRDEPDLINLILGSVAAEGPEDSFLSPQVFYPLLQGDFYTVRLAFEGREHEYPERCHRNIASLLDYVNAQLERDEAIDDDYLTEAWREANEVSLSFNEYVSSLSLELLNKSDVKFVGDAMTSASRKMTFARYMFVESGGGDYLFWASTMKEIHEGCISAISPFFDREILDGPKFMVFPKVVHETRAERRRKTREAKKAAKKAAKRKVGAKSGKKNKKPKKPVAKKSVVGSGFPDEPSFLRRTERAKLSRIYNLITESGDWGEFRERLRGEFPGSNLEKVRSVEGQWSIRLGHRNRLLLSVRSKNPVLVSKIKIVKHKYK